MKINYVQSFEVLFKLMDSRYEIIIYPVGNEGSTFLEFFECQDMSKRFCCVAADEVREGVVQSFVNSLPVIPFSCMLHFRNTALLIVVAPSPYHKKLEKELLEFGFENIAFITDELNARIKSDLEKTVASGYTIIWSMNQILNKITHLERKIDGQEEIRGVHTETFSRYRNCFLGKKIVILAGGPSAKYYTPLQDAIHIGVNFAWQREDICLDYLFTQDRWQNELSDLKMEDGFDKIRHEIFIGKCIDSYPRPNYPENVSIKRKNVLRYYLDECPRPLNQVIHQDIRYHPIRCFGSTSFAALSFALFTYPKEIYLVGFDTASFGSHFYKHPDPKYSETSKNSTPSLSAMKVGYAKFKMFAQQYYPDTDIISVNPIGLKGLFKDLYTEEFKEYTGGGGEYNSLIVLDNEIYNAAISSNCREAA